MATYASIFGGDRHVFADLRAVLAAASPRRSGDELAGLAAASAAHRVAAQSVLADLPLKVFLDEALVPYEDDEVTRLIIDTHDAAAFATISHLTVGGFREWLLSYGVDAQALRAIAPGVTPEMAAAVSKLMRNQDLISVARKMRVVTAFRDTIGLPGRLSTRLQPNHPTDDLAGIAASTLDGLLYGSGDAVIGVNPASDNLPNCLSLLAMLDELRVRYAIPTQTCVLTHVTNAIALMGRGAPVDLVFQSIAGTQAANAGFGVTLEVLREAREAALSLKRGSAGTNVMYFETGQGAALSAGAHHGIDQQTVEARAYAVARAFDPLIVNTVVGFIGPEYLYDGKQIIRAGLEDHFCAKLMGLPMGRRRLLHQPCRGRPGRHGRAYDPARRRGHELPHHSAWRRRRHAELPEPVVPRRALPALRHGRARRAGVRRLVGGDGHDGREPAYRAATRQHEPHAAGGEHSEMTRSVWRRSSIRHTHRA